MRKTIYFAALAAATHGYWNSVAQFERGRLGTRPDAHHASGPGKTAEHILGAGVRRFPALVPVAPGMDGVEESQRAARFFRERWAGQSFMAIGMQDPVLGPPAIDRDFGTIDFLTLLDSAAMEPRLFRLFSADVPERADA